MFTFKEFLLIEFDQMAQQPAGSQTNVANAQLEMLKKKQTDLLKKKQQLQQKFDGDMQRSQVAINSASMTTEDQAPNPAAQPSMGNPAAINPTSPDPTQKEDPQVTLMKQKQQASLRQKTDGDKQLDSEIKRTQAAIDVIMKQQQTAVATNTPVVPPPSTGMGNMARSGNPEKSATPSGNKTTQTIAPSARVGFGTSFK